MAKGTRKRSRKITKIQITDEKLTGRGGLCFILKYIENTQFYALCQRYLGSLIGSKKGFRLLEILQQVLAWFIDGSDHALRGFDRRRQDEAYAGLLETRAERLASSHQIKRFFRKLLGFPRWGYRQILRRLFLWRLQVEQPDILILFGDTMVLNNDDAVHREGVSPTYKKVKGFHPLQISWQSYIIDAAFREGRTHTNAGSEFIRTITHLVQAVRRYYRDIPIILCTDAGFLDEANFRYFEERLRIFYICAGKQYDSVQEMARTFPASAYHTLAKRDLTWRYVEFGSRLKSWRKMRRCIFSTLAQDQQGQMQLDFIRTDMFLYTNLGQDPNLTAQLVAAGGAKYLAADTIIQLDHQRGQRELNHRSLKEFATKEQLPFKRFGMNQAYYYFLLFSHFLAEAYKRDVTVDVLPVTSYPTTFRRQVIDFAVKLVTHGGQHILKVTRQVAEALDLQQLWERCWQPTPILLC